MINPHPLNNYSYHNKLLEKWQINPNLFTDCGKRQKAKDWKRLEKAAEGCRLQKPPSPCTETGKNDSRMTLAMDCCFIQIS